MKITLTKIPAPTPTNVTPVNLTQETMNQRKANLLQRMEQAQLDAVVIYADREHGANFEYFTGFIPRFEEALLVVHQDGRAVLLLGNENVKMGSYSRIDAKVIHVPDFSLPNQPMEGERPFEEYLLEAGLEAHQRIAAIGWKYFTAKETATLFDLPYFIVAALKSLLQTGKLVNGAGLLVAPDRGLRTINNANEIVHYEYGATLAGKGILATLNGVALGITEGQLATNLAQFGQPNTVTSICATGDRFTDAVLYPRDKALRLGDTFSTTVGYKGGLSSRGSYVARSRADLPEAVRDYEERLAKPYYRALVTWLETIRIGMTAGDLYRTIQQVLPQEDYHWTLNPGHFVADEEWLSSPFFPDSQAVLQSGQLFQLDIIPKIPGYGGVGCEDGIALCDEALRNQFATEYPDFWQRIQRRREYVTQYLQIQLPEEVLPLNDVLGYYRPYLLDQKRAFQVLR